jgi:hypothetical protein
VLHRNFGADKQVVFPAQDDECLEPSGGVAGMLVRPQVAATGQD